MIPHYERVKELCREIHERHLVSSSFATDDPAYHELVALGREGIPALLRRLQDHMDHREVTGRHYDGLAIWEPIIALYEITGTAATPEDGVKQEDGFWKAHLPSLLDHWLNWGREQGFKWDD